jgi:hypothetical protein
MFTPPQWGSEDDVLTREVDPAQHQAIQEHYGEEMYRKATEHLLDVAAQTASMRQGPGDNPVNKWWEEAGIDPTLIDCLAAAGAANHSEALGMQMGLQLGYALAKRGD